MKPGQNEELRSSDERTYQILKRFNTAQDRLVVQSSDLSLGSLAGMIGGRAIDIEPHYQRRHRWSAQKQSALIESFLLNVPVPPIYLAEDKLGRYSVVDGKQRLTAIYEYLSGKFALHRLESFDDAEGLYFEELPEDIRNALAIRPYLRVITILKQSDPLLKYEVFIRLNRGGESMEAQELRNVAFRGPLNDLIVRLSGNTFLKNQLKIKDKKSPMYQNMVDVELVLRFLTLREVWRHFSGGMREAMDNFMIRHQLALPSKQEEYEHAFCTAIERCSLLWGDHAFRRPDGTTWRSQLLNGMYDSQMVAASELSNSAFERALHNREIVIDRTRRLFSDLKFDRSVREATSNPGRVRYRIEAVLNSLTF